MLALGNYSAQFTTFCQKLLKSIPLLNKTLTFPCAKKYSILLKPLNEDHKKRRSEINDLNIELSTSKKWILDNSQVNYVSNYDYHCKNKIYYYYY